MQSAFAIWGIFSPNKMQKYVLDVIKQRIFQSEIQIIWLWFGIYITSLQIKVTFDIPRRNCFYLKWDFYSKSM